MIDTLSTHAGLVGLVFFFAFFLLVMLWLIRPGAKEYYNAQAKIPLKGDSDDK